jgi:MFS family permease
MVGAMLSNFIWAKLTSKGFNKLTANIAIAFQIIAIFIAINASSLYAYMVLFFLIGAALDGNRIASGNLILSLAPPEKRPIYVALQINIVSFGLFFSMLGGVILHFFSYDVLYASASNVLFLSLYYSFKLVD